MVKENIGCVECRKEIPRFNGGVDSNRQEPVSIVAPNSNPLFVPRATRANFCAR
jgi:hypothetical protein